MQTFKTILIALLIVIGLAIAGFFYLANQFSDFGGNIGSITCVDDQKLKDEYIIQYLDSFFVHHPEYKVPDSISWKQEYHWLDYEHLSLTKFYFSEKPKEVYYIQWSGPGCVNIRFTYDPITSKSQGVFRGDPEDKIQDSEIQRIKNRFETEIIPKLEDIIRKYEPKDSIYRNY